MIIIQNPELLLFLLLVPVWLFFRYRQYKKRELYYVTYSDVSELSTLPGNWLKYKYIVFTGILSVALILIITALSRPVVLDQTIDRNAEGIDIVLVLDISTSMLAEDLRPNRFISTKNVASEFIDRRSNDRIGIVIFARQSFTLIPPTLDHRLVKLQLEELSLDIVRNGLIADGTAIGMGIASAVNRLRYSEAISKVVILLTDGENNAGEIDPLTASDLAVTYGIRIYTIGASTEGTAPYPIDDPVFGRRYHPIKVDIDEPMLTEIAAKTGGRYFRARDSQSLQSIYLEIDRLERSEIDELIYIDKKDVYQNFLLAGIILFFITVIIDRVLIKY